MHKLREKIKTNVPFAVRIIFIITLVCIVINIAAVLSDSFADFFSRYVGMIFRGILSYITVIIPFSVAEALLIMIPVIFVFLIVHTFRISDNRVRSNRFMFSVMSVIPLLYSLMILGFGTGYYGSTIDEKMELDRAEVSAAELYETAIILRNEVNTIADEIDFANYSFSVSPYSVRETGDAVLRAYDKIYDKYTFISPLYSKVKPVILSEPMTYTHIAGVYSFFTGEANVNTNFPDYTIPFTVAHELAHQRGIAREDEANFVAFLVCKESDDPYIRYSGYLNLFEYVSSALYSADQELYAKVASTLNTDVRYELMAYSKFFDKYRDSVAADVSGAVNDAYLKLQGTEGTRSYGLVVDLAVAYYKK
ncbi:MAG: DUF3810 domain-containing protein [Clostridia bacterium]|nr:DUF3810 domain-containing protein [Clostridia bacterium]